MAATRWGCEGIAVRELRYLRQFVNKLWYRLGG
jgi:hypothetical protein